jgi:hypothetical protein
MLMEKTYLYSKRFNNRKFSLGNLRDFDYHIDLTFASFSAYFEVVKAINTRQLGSVIMADGMYGV